MPTEGFMLNFIWNIIRGYLFGWLLAIANDKLSVTFKAIIALNHSYRNLSSREIVYSPPVLNSSK